MLWGKVNVTGVGWSVHAVPVWLKASIVMGGRLNRCVTESGRNGVAPSTDELATYADTLSELEALSDEEAQRLLVQERSERI